LINCGFRLTAFLDTVVLYNTQISLDRKELETLGPWAVAATSLSDVLLPNPGTPFVFNADHLYLDSFELGPSVLPRIDFEFYRPPGSKLSAAGLTQYNTLITQVKNLCATKIHNDKPALDEANIHLDHQKTMYRMEYLKDNPTFFNLLAYLGYQLLEWTVGNGYHGETRFALFSLTLIVIFAFFYYWRYRKDILYYIDHTRNKGETIDMPPARRYRSHFRQRPGSQTTAFVTFAKCFWFSFVIFINPRFPPSYFKFGNGFLVFLLTEWLIGVVMIILFLIFIASQYSFVKSIIGLG
jgi:hypothetical protein